MSGLIGALNAGRTSLSTNQKVIEITGNNIANVNTEGYSRQKAKLTAYPAVNIDDFFIANGVKVADVEREFDFFTTRQIQDKSASLGEESGKSSPLAELERIFNVSENNLATEIDRFFDSWQELSSNPSSQVERDIVIQRGELLAAEFVGIRDELDAIYSNINQDLASKVGDINSKLQEIADLNKFISTVEITGNIANTHRDRRDLLMEELSFSMGITYYEGDTGMINVSLPGGMPLVQNGNAMEFKYEEIGNQLNFYIQSGDSRLNLASDHLGGELKGMITVRDDIISGLISDLDALAYSLVTNVNTQHQAGVGLDGVGGRNFFNTMASQDGASLNISVAIQDGNQLAAGASAAPGDNINALLIAGLGEEKLLNGGTFVDGYANITATVGIEASQNRLSLQGAEDALVQMRNIRDNKVGVSLEDEMINLIQFQRGFQASAKLLSTVDEMLVSLINVK